MNASPPRSADRFQLKLLLHRYSGRFLTLAGGLSGAFPDVDRQQDHRDHKRQRVQQDNWPDRGQHLGDYYRGEEQDRQPAWNAPAPPEAYTGLRWGEATALRVCDIDLERRRVDVRRAFSDVGGRVVLGTPKSHQSRTVPVPRFVVAELTAATCGKHADQLVFTMPGGSIIRLSNWRGASFLPARDRAGLSTRFRIHDYADTCVMPTSA